MEDHFLYKLRNGQLQNNKNNYKSKKIIEYRKDVNLNNDLHKQITKLIEKVVDVQKNTVNCMEKIAAFQNKQSNITNDIAFILKSLSESPKKQTINKEQNRETQPNDKRTIKKKPKLNEKQTSYKLFFLNNEKKIFTTIKNMRKSNHTWNEIADHLKKNSIPTLTDKNTWVPNLVLYFYKKMSNIKNDNPDKMVFIQN